VPMLTSGARSSLTALPPKANIRPRNHDVRYVPKADIGTFTAAPQTQQSRWPDE